MAAAQPSSVKWAPKRLLFLGALPMAPVGGVVGGWGTGATTERCRSAAICSRVRPCHAQEVAWIRRVSRFWLTYCDRMRTVRAPCARVDPLLHQQGLDSTTPAGKAMFQMLGVFAEFDRSIIQERVWLQRARKDGKRARIQEALMAPGRMEGVRKLANRFGSTRAPCRPSAERSALAVRKRGRKHRRLRP